MTSENSEYKDDYRQMIEALTIFCEYLPPGQELAEASFHAVHDELRAGPDPDVVSAEHLERLEALGWHPDRHNGGFYYFT